MRDVINKGLTKDVILKGAWEAFQGGWKRVKLYFMLGLPGETDEDIAAIAELANDIAATYFELPKEERQGRPEITASTSFLYQSHLLRSSGRRWERQSILMRNAGSLPVR